MKIYTGNPWGHKDDIPMYHKYNLGVMVSDPDIRSTIKGLSVAIDNGAYMCHKRGYPWIEQRFWRILEKAYDQGFDPDFIVAPDIVGSKHSLFKSYRFAQAHPCDRWALAVQDGMQPKDIGLEILYYFSHIFVGGTVEWKWQTAHEWVEFAHANGKRCHIGRCGKLDKLIHAKEIGADSVDSTSIRQDKKWHYAAFLEDQTCLEFAKQ